MSNRTAYSILGLLYLIIWLTHAPQLHVFRPGIMEERARQMAEAHLELPDFIREQSPVGHLDQESLEQFIYDELLTLWIGSFCSMAVGVLAGVMMMRGWLTGVILALGLMACHLLLMWRTFDKPGIGLAAVLERALDFCRVKWAMLPYETAHQMLTWVVLIAVPVLVIARRRVKELGHNP